MSRKCIFTVALLLSTSLASVQEVRAQDPELRLQIAKARLYIESQQVHKAFDLIAGLEGKYKNHVEIITLEAEANYNIGNRRRARELIDSALKTRPNDEDIKSMKKVYDRVSYVSVDRYIELTGNTLVEQVARGEGRKEYKKHAALGVVVENNKLRHDAVRRADNTLERYEQDKQRAEFYHEYDHNNGNRSRVSVYVADGVVGAGASYAMPDKKGTTTVAVKVQEPEWDFVEGVVDEGTKDSISVARTQRLMPYTTGAITAGINRYGLDGSSNAANSFATNGGLSYIFEDNEVVRKALGDGSDISLNYWLDAEYAFDKDQGIDGSGIRFDRFPIDSYEFHVATLNVSKSLSGRTNISGYGGYVFDRLGGKGTHVGGRIGYLLDNGFEASLEAARSISSEGSNSALERVGANVKWNF